ncbi:MAG: helicase-exonuclease AddAB subunit AddA [Clostridia bacterium]|nr:helicase-exonuclease AddAB subunit AddA [Clostridia bacterium]
MKWTKRQAQAIEERNTNLLVSAAAGSGKTAVLVERVKRLVLKDHIGLDRMLIVTFTKAAASEMKEKIQRSLYAELKVSEDSQEKQAYLRQQLHTIATANISTFHSFALEIVHRYYHVIGKSPRLSVCDEVKQKALKDEAIQEMLENLFEQDDVDFKTFLDCYCTSKDNKILIDMIFNFHQFSKSIANPAQWFDDALTMLSFERSALETMPTMLYLKERLKDSLVLVCSYFTCAIQNLEISKDEGDKILLKRLADKIREDIAAVESIKSVIEKGLTIEALAAIEEGIKFSTLKANKVEAPYYEGELKDYVTALRDEGKKNFKKLSQWCMHANVKTIEQECQMIKNAAKVFFRLVNDFDARYAEKKDKLGVLDFSDIEHYALDILKDEAVCDEYKEKFDFIFIDEYQDSNRVQETLINQICRKDNLFMVGDVKQSIYKFRLAEPELFIRKYSDYKSGQFLQSKIVDLNSNFRSKEGVVNFVNTLFSSLMSKQSTGLDYDEDAALVKGSPYSGSCDFKPLLYLVEENASIEESTDEEWEEEASQEEADIEIEQLKLIELEALQAAEIIKENLGKLVHDDQSDMDIPLRYKDMVILLRAVSGSGEIFYKALADSNIPVFLDRSEGYFDTLEVKVFLNLLRFIDNRRQDIPMISILHSPIFGFSADELAEIRIFSRKAHAQNRMYFEAFQYYLMYGEREELRSKCNGFWEKIERWKLRSVHLPLGDFIWSLMVETGYNDFVGAIPGGAQRKANLLALVDKATAYEISNFRGLSGFIRYIETISAKKEKVNIGQAKILSEGADVVRIMTIHKSKGLEFPFVLLGGLCKKLNSHNNKLPIAYDKDLGIGLKLVNPKTGLYVDTLSYKLLNDKRQQEEMAESIRILYVALTRPKDRLVLLGSVKNAQKALLKAKKLLPGDVRGASTFLDMILAATSDFLPVKVVGKAMLEIAQENALKDKAAFIGMLETGFNVDEAQLPISKEDIVRRLSFRYKDEENTKSKRKYTVSQLASLEKAGNVVSVQEFDFGKPKFLLEKSKLSGSEVGTAYHTVMEHIAFTPEGKESDEIREFINSLVQLNILSAQEASLLDTKAIAAFFSSQTGKRVLASSAVFKEAPFVFKTVYESKEVLVQGIIDCYFKEEDALVIVDYKSNFVDMARQEEEKERMKQIYIPQMRQYKEALEAITGKRVKECIIYLFGLNDQISIVY